MSHFEHPDLKLRGLVHDLNNVFQTILDAADLIPDGSRWKRMATTIQNSAEHGIRLSRELLESREAAFDFSLIAESAIQFARDVLLVTSGHAGSGALYAKLPYDPQKSFAPIARIGATPVVIVAPAGSAAYRPTWERLPPRSPRQRTTARAAAAAR